MNGLAAHRGAGTQVENWQAVAPGAGGSSDQPEPSAAMPPGAEERARTICLIDFLGDYDARRNPPVYDIREYDLFMLRDADLPCVPGIGLFPGAESWLAVDFLAKELHRDLFRQRELLATGGESLELVWGFGRLRWRPGGAVVDYPLICVPVEVEQDQATQQIRVCPAGAPEVEARCLAALSLADRAAFMTIRQSLSDDGAELWDAQVLRDLLLRLVRAIDHQGTVVEQAAPPAAGSPAVVDGSWALYMRRRLPDYQSFLERMRALYRDQSAPVPDPLRAVVSDSPSALPSQAAAADGGRHAAADPLLLPLPTNEEQQAILTQVQRSMGVTVQGPAGPAR